MSTDNMKAPTFSTFGSSEEERINRAMELFKLINTGAIKIKDAVLFKLSEGKKAHDFIENGNSSSKILLIPDE
jgi:NADPH:quinone reductase